MMHIRMDLEVIPAYSLDYITAVKLMGLKSGYIVSLFNLSEAASPRHMRYGPSAVMSTADRGGTGLYECNITERTESLPCMMTDSE